MHVRSRGDVVFLGVFAVYTTVAILFLLLGLIAAAAADPGVNALLLSWAGAGGVLAPVLRATANGARLTEPPLQIFVDYALSVVYIGAGVYLVWRRPWDWVARLLGLAFVGTAVGYNFQTHVFFAIAAGNPAAGGVPGVRQLNIFHWIYHTVAGATYVHALLLFPNGKLVPRGLVWLPLVLYALVIEELAFPLSSFAATKACPVSSSCSLPLSSTSR